MLNLKSLTLALCFASQASGAGAQTTVPLQNAASALTAQERLDAIRHSLVETALQGTTQVKSTQWLDAQGQLRDSSSFRSGLEVRGVRVLSYSRDSAGQAKAQLDAATAPQDLARTLDTQSGRNATCEQGMSSALKHVIGLTTSFEPGTSTAIQRLVRQQIAAQWLSADERHWRMLDRAAINPMLSTGFKTTAYEQALTRNGPEQLPWRAHLHLGAAPSPLQAWEKLAGLRAHHLDITMTLTVKPMDGQGAQFQAAHHMNLPLNQPEWSSMTLDPQGADQLQALWSQWSDRLSPWLGCDNVQPKVTDLRVQNLQINAGTLAGVRQGDEWLLADPQAFPSRLVDKQSASMILAKVVEVAPHHARLSVLAGPANALQVNWRAWPAESLSR
jgi:hypothetical protein